MFWIDDDPLEPEAFKALLERLRERPPKIPPGSIQTEPSEKHWLKTSWALAGGRLHRARARDYLRVTDKRFRVAVRRKIRTWHWFWIFDNNPENTEQPPQEEPAGTPSASPEKTV